MKRLLWGLLAIQIVLAAACTSGGSGSNSDDDDDDDAATTATPTPTPAGTPSFATHIIPILEQSCGTGNNACHSRVAYAANSGEDCRGWLSLENASIGSVTYGPTGGASTGCPDEPLYDRLTAPGLADAWQCGPPADGAGTKVPYVVAGDADASYLFRKINGGPYCAVAGASDPMPQTGALDSVTIDVIRRWINGGALP